jgi:hypothetical protein
MPKLLPATDFQFRLIVPVDGDFAFARKPVLIR